MIIKKFQGRTKEEALESARRELGVNIVEMNVKAVKPKGIMGLFRGTRFEVTVAREEENEKYSAASAKDVEKEGVAVSFSHNEPQGKIIPMKKEDVKEDTKAVGLAVADVLSTYQSEKQLSRQDVRSQPEESKNIEEEKKEEDTERINFLKILYNKMTDNEINEKYANEMIDEIDRNCKADVTLDFMLSEIYQRMILKLGKPYVMEENGKTPKVIFFVGPTGVGKTTTIAKIASTYKLEHRKKVAMLTADTYRIAAAEQLRTYANILEVPFRVVYTAKEIENAVEDFREYDYIFVDTTGHSPNDEAQCENMSALINSVDIKTSREVFLVLSASTKYKDLMRITDTYKEITDYKLIFTKLDETSALGNIYNLKLYTGAKLSYVTYGQNVPDDIEYFNPQSTVKQLLGGRR